MDTIKLRDEFIKLGQALKAANYVDSGVEAKIAVMEGRVSVNGEKELRRGRKLYENDVVFFQENDFQRKELKIIK